MSQWTGKYCNAFQLGTNETLDCSYSFENEMPRDENGVINGTLDQYFVITEPDTLTVKNLTLAADGFTVMCQVEDSEAAKPYVVWFRALFSDGKRRDATPMLIGGQQRTPAGTSP